MEPGQLLKYIDQDQKITCPTDRLHGKVTRSAFIGSNGGRLVLSGKVIVQGKLESGLHTLLAEVIPCPIGSVGFVSYSKS